jgi:hypothetical protein
MDCLLKIGHLDIANLAVQSGISGKFLVPPIVSIISRNSFLNNRCSCARGDSISSEDMCV